MAERRAKNPGVYIVRGDRFYDPYGDGTHMGRSSINDDNKIGFEDLPISADGKRAKYKGKWYEIHDAPWYSGVHRVQAIFPYSKNPATWTAKQERQYKAIERSEMKRGATKRTAQRIAAATVNKRRAANPSPAQIRARKAFARMAKERARAAKSGRAKNPRYVIRATDASGNERELAILQSPNKMQAVKRAKSLYKGHKKYTAELVSKDDFIGGRPGTQRLKRKRAKKNGVAKTAGKAIKKVTRAVLGGVSKVAGKGAKALKNPKYDLKAWYEGKEGPTYKSFAHDILRYAGSRKTTADKVVLVDEGLDAGIKPPFLKSILAKTMGPKSAIRFVNLRMQQRARGANPKRRRNLDHRDSHHQIEVRKHWRAGGLSQWQRAHHAGQHDLFAHGIKAKPRRNPTVKHYAVFYVIRGRAPIRVFEAFTKSPGAAIAAFKREYPGWNREYSGGKFAAKLQAKRNPSASKIRKKFAGRVSGHKTLYFPKGAPNGMAKLGRLVSMKLKGGRVIKPARRNPAPEIWLCSDTHGKLWLGSTKPGRLYDGAPGDLGTMTNIEYSESKPHLGYPDQTIWFHKLGEVSGRCPHLVVNDDGDLIIRGGAYKITRAGIVD